jgi:two-component system, OmpR family, phosphate regulon response regulator OmpR
VGSRILLIDDDKRLAEMVGRYLSQAGFEMTHCFDARSGLAALSVPASPASTDSASSAASTAASVASGAWVAPDLILLDLMLPDADGLDVCRDIRRLGGPAGRAPILMLTARGELTDRVVGLEMGADDYLPKPFEPRELLARVRALLRRSQMRTEAEVEQGRETTGTAPAAVAKTLADPAAAGAGLPAVDEDPDVLVFGEMEIDVAARRVRIQGMDRPLTAYQFDLLLALARNAGRVLSRERLMDLARGETLEAFDRSIDVHIGKIRQAIERDPRQPRRLLTVRGSGYVLARQQDSR